MTQCHLRDLISSSSGGDVRPPNPGCVHGHPGRWRGAALPALGLRWAVAAMFVVLDLPCEEEDTSFEPPSQKGKKPDPK